MTPPIAFILSIFLWLIALVAYAYYNVTIGCDPLKNNEIKGGNELVPHFVHDVMNIPGYLGIYYACLFSGALSSMSTAYNSTSNLIWEDWLRPMLESKLSKHQIMVLVKSICKLTEA